MLRLLLASADTRVRGKSLKGTVRRIEYCTFYRLNAMEVRLKSVLPKSKNGRDAEAFRPFCIFVK